MIKVYILFSAFADCPHDVVGVFINKHFAEESLKNLKNTPDTCLNYYISEHEISDTILV